MNISFNTRKSFFSLLRKCVLVLILLGTSTPVVFADHMGNHQRPLVEAPSDPDTKDKSSGCSTDRAEADGTPGNSALHDH